MPSELTRKEAASAIKCVIDKRRAARGRGGLTTNGELRTVATRHARRMLATDCFAHRCPGEPDLGGRVRASAYVSCACAWSVGENLAWGARRKGSASSIVGAWMKSAGHRANLLKRSFVDVGVAAVRGRPRHSESKRAVTYVVVFGVRKR